MLRNNYSEYFFRQDLLNGKICRYGGGIMCIFTAMLWTAFPCLYLVPFYVFILLLGIDLFITESITKIVKEEGNDIRSELWQIIYKDNKHIYMLNPYTNVNPDELEREWNKLNKITKNVEQ